MIKIFGHYVARVFLLLGAVEFLVLGLSLTASYYIRVGVRLEQQLAAEGAVFLLASGYAAITLLVMIALGLYQRGLPWGAGFIVRLVMTFAVSTAATAVLFLLVPDATLGRGVIGLTLLFSLVGILSVRSLFLRFAGSQVFQHRVVVLGTGNNAALVGELEVAPHQFQVVSYVNLGDAEQVVAPTLQSTLEGRLIDFVIAREADEIVVALDDRRRRLPVDEILDCKMSGVSVLDLASFFERHGLRINVDILQPSWLIFSSGFSVRPPMAFFKRGLDIVCAGVLLLLAAPVMAMVAMSIFVESRGRGTVLFHQPRVGQGGKVFLVHKFRSMSEDAEADGVARWAQQDDPRVTRVGRFIRKTRLDELPQLFNVLKGEMALVGPRPERPEFVADLAKQLRYYNERHRVKPGITGWAQLNYQYGSTLEDAKSKLEYDLYYVKNYSLFLDLVILLQTVEVVLWGKGAR